MANETTASVVGNLGHGTKTRDVFHSVGSPVSSIVKFAYVVDIEQGYATEGVTKLGARIAASSYSEAGAANANTALPTPSQVTLTTAAYVCTIAPTTQAINRVDPSLISLDDLAVDEICYPLETLVAYDSSIGLVSFCPSLASNIYGTSGAALTPQTVINAYKTLCTAIGQTGIDVILWLDLKGLTDLELYGLGTAASILGIQQGADKLFLDLLEAQGIDQDGYITSWGRVHIFLEPKPGSLYATGGDTYAPMFIPYLRGANGIPMTREMAGRFANLERQSPGKKPLCPAYAVGYRMDPAAAQKLAAGQDSPLNNTRISNGGIPIEIVARANAGQSLVIVDAWTELVTAEANDKSHVAVRYVS